jgi:hypothetical protein
MTLSEIYDRLLAEPVSIIEWKNKSSPLRCPEPMIVRDVMTDERADAWIEASEDGLALHFNARDRDSEMRGQTEPLANIEWIR